MENWREVPGFNNYFINIDTPEGRCIKKYKNGKIRELNHTVRNGRIYWCLTNDHKEYFWQAARWIAITYPELVQNEYFDGAEICHEDNNSLNSHPSNLKWGSHKYNMNNVATRKEISEALKGNKCHLGKKHSESAKEKMRQAKLGKTLTDEHKKNVSKSLLNRQDTSTPVNQYTLDGELVAWYPSISEIIRQNPDKKLSKSNIWMCCQGIRNSHAGFMWKYAKSDSQVILGS